MDTNAFDTVNGWPASTVYAENAARTTALGIQVLNKTQLYVPPARARTYMPTTET